MTGDENQVDTLLAAPRPPSKIVLFLWVCAGANIRIATKTPTAQPILTSIGGAVFLTSLFAVLSASYASYFVFNSVPQAVVLGLLWGLMIFNLDRYIVSSMRKQSSLVATSLTIFPRLLMAFLISAVVVVPLELLIFEPEINAYLPVLRDYREKKIKEKADFGARQQLIDKAQAEIDELNAKAEELQTKIRAEEAKPGLKGIREHIAKNRRGYRQVEDEVRNLKDRFTREVGGLPGSSGVRGLGRRAKNIDISIQNREAKMVALDGVFAELELERNRLEVRLNRLLKDQRALKSRVDEHREEISFLRKEKAEKLNEDIQRSRENLRSLGARLETLHLYARDNPTADWSITMLRLLFLLIEISPLIIKVMNPPTAYDVLRDKIEKLEGKQNIFPTVH